MKAIEKLAATYANTGQFQPALKIIEGLEDPQTKASALSDMVSAYYKAGKANRGLRMASQAYNNAKLIKGNVFKDLTTFEIIGKLVEGGDYEKAFRISRKINSATIKFLAISNLALELMEKDLDVLTSTKSLMYRIIKELETRKEFGWDQVDV